MTGLSLIARADASSARGGFIRDYAPWRYWGTFTFAELVSEARASTAFRGLMLGIAADMNIHFALAWGAEAQLRGAPHFHALLAPLVDTKLNPHSVGRQWRRTDSAAGFSRLQSYDPKRNAARYLGDHETWAVGIVCPRASACRRPGRGCIVGPSPWW